MLKTIAIVTLLVRNLASVEGAYHEHLDYNTEQRARIGAELAAVWDTPALRGRDYVLMQPASGEPVYLRFVEMPPGMDEVAALETLGWSATEILVQDPDGLARKLEKTPFRVIGPPADLMPGADAPRAMQVRGPAGELLYFTRIIPGGSGFDLGSARTPVDRVFITVVAGASLKALRGFYGGVLGMPMGDDLAWPIEILARAYGLPADTLFPLTVAILPKNFLVELDQFPPAARPRHQPRDSLPAGMALVSFTVDSLEGRPVLWRQVPRRITEFPYNGRRVGVTLGPAGEWIEAIETPPALNPPAPGRRQSPE